MSEIRLNKQAYEHNLAQIAAKIGSKDKVMLVLKDNAYGHGSKLLASVASGLGFVKFVVKNESEADEIAQFGDEILILSHIADGSEGERYIYAINDIEGLKRIKSASKIHLKFDTLMHRNGLVLDEIDEALRIIKERNLRLLGAFTHFRSADEMSADYFVQKQNFAEIKTILRQKFHGEICFHSHASAAFERSWMIDDECVRVGIAQFGYAQFDESLGLRRVLSLWADLLSKRTLKAGQGVGYGGVFVASCDMDVGTYDVGYADGLYRYDGVGDFCVASGEKILGRMSMDSISVASQSPSICVLDDARLWARRFGTIEYDVLVKLSASIKRRWI